VLDRLAAQPGLRAAVDLMVAWAVPTSRTARELAARMPVFEESGDPAVLEAALHLHLDTVTAAPEVADSIAREIDESNLVAALRLRGARLANEPPTGYPWIEGGRFPDARLEDIVHISDPEEVVAAITGGPHLPAWEEALEHWGSAQDLAGLEAMLRTARWRHEISRFRLGDPLGAAVPVGFVAAKQAEAHDVRLLARTIVHQLPVGDVQSRLVMS
jgi:vacuolar-type H+-ATPase subunit C/Vma6